MAIARLTRAKRSSGRKLQVESSDRSLVEDGCWRSVAKTAAKENNWLNASRASSGYDPRCGITRLACLWWRKALYVRTSGTQCCRGTRALRGIARVDGRKIYGRGLWPRSEVPGRNHRRGLRGN